MKTNKSICQLANVPISQCFSECTIDKSVSHNFRIVNHAFLAANYQIIKLSYLLILTLAYLFISTSANCQTFSPQVFSSGGNYVSTPNLNVSYTFGESFTPTLQNNSLMLTQGFQQPEIQLYTGNITGTFCAGSNINVPFTALGIFSSTNVFTAQLSNASGSFASPVNIGTLTGNTSGNISALIPLSTPVGTGYRIRVRSSQPVFTSPDNGSNIQVINACFVALNLKLFIEGYYDGANLMSPVLFNQGIGSVTTVVDAINVELRSPTFPYGLVASSVVLLNTNGTTTCSFSASPGNYFIVVKHRNAVETWSANPVTLSASAITYDFSNLIGKAYGSNQTQVAPNVWAFFSGDVNQDENVDLLDLTNVETAINNFTFGYYATDINGDGNVDLLDTPLLETNISNFVFSAHP